MSESGFWFGRGNGCFQKTVDSLSRGGVFAVSGGTENGRIPTFDASSSSTVYQDNANVVPRSHAIGIWERIS